MIQNFMCVLSWLDGFSTKKKKKKKRRFPKEILKEQNKKYSKKLRSRTFPLVSIFFFFLPCVILRNRVCMWFSGCFVCCDAVGITKEKSQSSTQIKHSNHLVVFVIQSKFKDEEEKKTGKRNNRNWIGFFDFEFATTKV